MTINVFPELGSDVWVALEYHGVYAGTIEGTVRAYDDDTMELHDGSKLHHIPTDLITHWSYKP